MKQPRSLGRALWILLLALLSLPPLARAEPERRGGAAVDDQRLRVPIGASPARGPASARVTIVAFSDFQCPFCSRANRTLEELGRLYGADLRLVFKHNPLPFHGDAIPAAEAALAAQDQGRFWPMHDRLFGDTRALKREDLERHAKELGLDLARFTAALDSGAYRKVIAADQAEAARLGAVGTPTFFINGRKLAGAQPLERFQALIDEELQRAREQLKGVAPPPDVYAFLTREGADAAVKDAPVAAKPAPVDTTIYRAAIGDAPSKGPKDAKVTIVYWSDFQCPFCSRAEGTLQQLLAENKDLRLVFKQQPLPFHSNAHLAAEAALAAHAQGKFWEMHARLFANQQALKREDLERHAEELGLDLKRFRAALDSGQWKARVDREAEEGKRLGATGTPTFFINGRKLTGAQPLAAFQERVAEARKDAEALMKAQRVPAARVYERLMKDAALAPVADKDKDIYQDPDADKVYAVDAGGGPSLGPAGAKVTLVLFSDFQCPFCGRLAPTLKALHQRYPATLRIVWRNYPLPFHQQAGLAAEAALAARAQGKFWEMHDLLFQNQTALLRSDLERYAEQLGLNMDSFRGDLDNSRFRAEVDADLKYGASLAGQAGSMGTPTAFINGRKLSGAQPQAEFEKRIDALLAAPPLQKARPRR